MSARRRRGRQPHPLRASTRRPWSPSLRGVLAAEGVTAGELGVHFVGELRMRALNREHLGDDQVTDVLSFPLEDAGEGVAAAVAATDDDVAVAAPARRRRHLPAPGAAAGGRTPGCRSSSRWRVLLVHGLLHLLGHDHEADAGEMALRQAELLERRRLGGTG